MFDAIAKGFRQAKNRLAGLTELTEQNIEPALREVRLSLLEADVELGVAKAFLARVRAVAVGQTLETRIKHEGVLHHVGASERFIKICHDELVALMSHEGEAVQWADSGATKIVLIGLQGSGKTTTCAKLARLLRDTHDSKPMLVAADMQRPAAVEQLQILGGQIDVPVFHIADKTPVEICAAAESEAKRLGCDLIVYDTAGRLSIDEQLMAELQALKAAVSPDNIYLVVDAMIGQDAVQTAKNFHERLDITGVIMTKLDGDARGGAALSVKQVTQAPILFCGIGETSDKFDEFRPAGMASRILGMGDVVGLMQDFEKVADEKKVEKDAARMLAGKFTLDDFVDQISMIQQMGSLRDLVDKLPLGGMFPGGLPDNVNLDDDELVRIRAIIQSMTRFEKADPYVLIREPGRAKRIAAGSGRTEPQITAVVQQFLFMKQMMGAVSQDLGLLGNIPGLKGIASMRKMRKLMQKHGAGGAPGMGIPGMGMPGMGLPGMGMPGMGMPGMGIPGMGLPGMGMPGMGMPGVGMPAGMGEDKRTAPLSSHEKNSRKAARKRQRGARKKGRK